MRTASIASFVLAALAGCSRDAPEESASAAPATLDTTATVSDTAPLDGDEAACAGPAETVDKGEGCTVERVRAGDGTALGVHDVALVRYSLRIDGTDKIVASTEGWPTAARIALAQPSASGTGATAQSAASAIAGFSRALAGERVGSKLTIRIPPALGYGAAGLPASGIPAETTLVAEVEILGIAR
ncbi:MAG: FKBP-type peptidyl-prolyl cis-trans isomerase [Planctomycetota bacterium]